MSAGAESRVQDGRHIPNTMPDYSTFVSQQQGISQLSIPDSSSLGPDENVFLSSTTYSALQQDTRVWILKSIELIQKKVPPETHSVPTSRPGRSKEDSSLYVGCGGNAYFHWRLSQFFKMEGDKEKASLHCRSAVTAVEVSLSMLPKRFAKGEEIAFYIGSAGIHALATVIYWISGYLSKTEDQLRKLLSFLPSCLSAAAPDEILYGKAGYLFCLQFVLKHVSKELCERLQVQEATRQVFNALIESGKKNSGIQFPKTGVLKYHFCGTDFNGAAHGTCGIIYMLLQFPSWCQERANLPWITATLDAILNSQLPSGNFPYSFHETKDELVHWCHGAPGVVYTLYHAHKVLGNDKTFLRSLDQALSVVWERGLLKKGVGLCHGVSGNGYAFLMMYRYTGAEEHLYRAHKMAEAMRSEEVAQEWQVYRDPQRYSVGLPDFPYSLMEGLGGAVCFCCDLLHPDTAAFPGYEGDI